MRKLIIPAAGILLVLTLTWAAFGEGAGQGQGGMQRFAQMREAQMKAVASLQENATKLKAMMEANAKAMQGRNFQDMTEEDRTKMRQQREEQTKLIAAIQQNLAQLQGVRGLIQENQQATQPLQDILATAQKENAKETAAKVQKLLGERQKQLEEKATGMGMTAEQVQQMQERMRQQ
jgi:hypothetical protein